MQITPAWLKVQPYGNRAVVVNWLRVLHLLKIHQTRLTNPASLYSFHKWTFDRSTLIHYSPWELFWYRHFNEFARCELWTFSKTAWWRMHNNVWLEETFFCKDSLLFFPLLFLLNSFLFYYPKSEGSFQTPISASLLKIHRARFVIRSSSKFLPSEVDTMMRTEA
jgi:hypothetical protein